MANATAASLSNPLERGMGGSVDLPGWATLMVAVPFVAMLAMAVFGLDQNLARPRQSRARRHFCEVGGNGAFLSDPDGTPWRTSPIRHIEATLMPLSGPQGEGAARWPGSRKVTGYIVEKG
jgi:hypothetical protein